MNEVTKRENIKNSIITVYEMIVGFLPFGHITQAMFEHKSRIQKERLDKFSEFLKDGFEQTTGKEFNPDNLYTEDFLDTFEIIMRKVVMTKSELKLKQYRNVMLKAMFESNFQDDMFLKYVSLIEETNEIQILILNNFSQHSKQNILNVMNFLRSDGQRNPVKIINKWKGGLKISYTGTDFKLNIPDTSAFQTVSEKRLSYLNFDFAFKRNLFFKNKLSFNLNLNATGGFEIPIKPAYIGVFGATNPYSGELMLKQFNSMVFGINAGIETDFYISKNVSLSLVLLCQFMQKEIITNEMQSPFPFLGQFSLNYNISK